VCDYLQKITHNQIGCGDDPIGVLIASHSTISKERKQILKALDLLKTGMAYAAHSRKVLMGKFE